MAVGDFEDRTTMKEGEVRITPPPTPGPTRKFYVGADHAPTREEALEMGRALFDQIAAQRVRDTHASRDSGQEIS
jgi:hypothetical protein